eukprot:gene15868-8843_t
MPSEEKSIPPPEFHPPELAGSPDRRRPHSAPAAGLPAEKVKVQDVQPLQGDVDGEGAETGLRELRKGKPHSSALQHHIAVTNPPIQPAEAIAPPPVKGDD